MLQEKGPVFVRGAVQDFRFLFQSDQRAGVVAHDVGEGNVPHGRQQVPHVQQLAALVRQQGKHLGFGVAVDHYGLEAQRGVHGARAFRGVDEFQLTGFVQGGNVLVEKARFFACIGLGGPFPVAGVGPKGGVGEGRNQQSVRASLHSTAHVVKVQVGQEDVCDVRSVVAGGSQAAVQGVVPVQVVVGKELFVLFLADSGVHQGESVSVFHQQQPHGPRAQVVFVCGVGALPQGFWDHAKHGAAVQFEKAGGNGGNFHRLARKNSVSRSPQSSASTPLRTSVLG